MDTDDLTEMAYACIIAANNITDILKTELGAACSQFNTEDEYLKGILKHVKRIEKGPEDYLDEWNVIDHTDVNVFKKKVKQLRIQIEKTIETPLQKLTKSKNVELPTYEVCMTERKIDKTREARIDDEVIVDCYGEAEHAMGWYFYLEDRLRFPFKAKCVAGRKTSPLKAGEEVEVLGIAPEEECEHDIFVMIQWEKRTFGVPLSQLEGIKVSKETKQAIDDWCYWVARGYDF